MQSNILEEMEKRYCAVDYAGVLELGRTFSVDEQLKIPCYNGAAHALYSWGYLTGLGNPFAARTVFRKFVTPEYIQRRCGMSHDMDLERINSLNREDAQMQI